MSPTFRALLSTMFSVCALAFAAQAQADSLDGTWSATPLTVSWSVKEWGPECGPKPSGGGEAGGQVTIASSGSGFKLSGLGRTYESGQCWEQMPGLAPRSRSAGSSVIQTTCTMPPGDPRHATVTTSWYPKGNSIQFVESGQYDSAIKKSVCSASVKRTRTLTRLTRAAPPPSAAATAPAPHPKPAVIPPLPGLETSATQSKSTATCQNPGPAVRLEITPRTKLMRPGERFQFWSIARDAQGCRVPVSTKWNLLGDSSAHLSQSGVLSVPEDAQGAQIQIEATVGTQSVTVGARIVSAEEFDRLLEGGNYGSMGESLDAAEIALASDHVELDEPKPAPAKKASSILVWIVGLLIGLVVLVTYFLLRRMRAHSLEAHRRAVAAAAPRSDSIPVERETPTEAHTPAQSDSSVRDGNSPAGEVTLNRLCPLCGKRYEEGALFCSDDGARLMRAN